MSNTCKVPYYSNISITHLVILYRFPLKCMRKEASVYFKITNLTSSESHTSRVNSGDLGAFIVPNETEIMQLGVQQSFIPSKQSKFIEKPKFILNDIIQDIHLQTFQYRQQKNYMNFLNLRLILILWVWNYK